MIWGTLSSSDFARYTYQPPELPNPAYDSLYEEMGDCGFNQVWNAHTYGWTGTTLEEYLEALNNNGMHAVLMKGDGGRFKIEDYSYAQHHKYEADWDYDEAMNQDLKGWYFFWHGNTWNSVRGEEDPTTPDPGASWRLSVENDSQGVFLFGPKETVGGALGGPQEYQGGWRSQTTWKTGELSLDFLSVFRVKADAGQLADTDSVFSIL